MEIDSCNFRTKKTSPISHNTRLWFPEYVGQTNFILPFYILTSAKEGHKRPKKTALRDRIFSDSTYRTNSSSICFAYLPWQILSIIRIVWASQVPSLATCTQKVTRWPRVTRVYFSFGNQKSKVSLLRNELQHSLKLFQGYYNTTLPFSSLHTFSKFDRYLSQANLFSWKYQQSTIVVNYEAAYKLIMMTYWSCV